MTSPKNSHQQNDERIYTWPPTGERFTSVTTILSVLNKPFLVGWAAKEAAQYALTHHEELREMTAADAIKRISRAHKDIAQVSSELGTRVHACVERSIDGQPPLETPDHMRFFDAWKLVFKPEFLLSEKTVFNRAEGYAGTFDFVARIGEANIIIDVKTGKAVYPEVALQLAAYAHGEFVGHDDKEVGLPRIDGAAVLHLRPTGYKYYPVRIDSEVWDAFRYIKEAYRWQRFTSRDVISRNGVKQ